MDFAKYYHNFSFLNILMFFVVFGHFVALIYSVMTVLMTFVHIRTLAAPVSMLTTLQMYLQSEPVETPLGSWQKMMKHPWAAGLKKNIFQNYC